ncbi:hypothetical protein PV394_07370 [Streptomyces sp. NE06-03E]|uniref:Secreted protein n=1 Tax=Streptomyces silvae TaxID=2803812 RepID=A0ABU8A114_9ACTN|nr:MULTISPECIES: hypothetical protein [unclassified Streptomyces]MDX3054956.1 hypothetical protein [Streptomyces sp. NE06-03E]MDX3326962.1 hypothetical protein [Streptomyces sp. ME02-6979-3A]MDX3430519.1 hypothetical protein [Streptomyces sp. ME01-18a]MDX3686459.1 hypothetical protein [Streptomyces sp. AK04-4c]
MSFRTRALFISGTIGALAALIGVPLAFASETSGTFASAVSAEVPPSAVEEFSYPGAAGILATKGITLKKGDGHILLADCDPAEDQILVRTVADPAVGRADEYCFRATAKTGYLTLELPRVFMLELAASEQPVSADLTVGGATTTVDVEAGGFASVGEGTVGGARSVLVELRITG